MILIKNTYRTLIKFAVRRRAPSGTVSVHHQGSSFPCGLWRRRRGSSGFLACLRRYGSFLYVEDYDFRYYVE